MNTIETPKTDCFKLACNTDKLKLLNIENVGIIHTLLNCDFEIFTAWKTFDSKQYVDVRKKLKLLLNSNIYQVYSISDIFGNVVGIVETYINRIGINVFIAIAPKYRRKGHATKALNEIVNFLSNIYMFTPIILDIPDNPSEKVTNFLKKSNYVKPFLKNNFSFIHLNEYDDFLNLANNNPELTNFSSLFTTSHGDALAKIRNNLKSHSNSYLYKLVKDNDVLALVSTKKEGNEMNLEIFVFNTSEIVFITDSLRALKGYFNEFYPKLNYNILSNLIMSI